MVNPTALLQGLLLTQLLAVIYGMDIGGRNLQSLRNSIARDDWTSESRINGNELSQEEAIADLLKVSPWAFYSSREKPSSFARESRNSGFQQRMGRDEEIQFTETSRSPPFAPRLGRVVHYSPKFRRLTIN